MMTPASLREQLAGDAALAVDRVWLRFRPPLRRLARRLTDDRDLRKDLVQEAMISLWDIDPTRFDFREWREFTYVRNALMNRMRDVWRAEMSRCVMTVEEATRLSGVEFAPLPGLPRGFLEGRHRRSCPEE